MGKTWKAVELAIAKILGGERVPITGRSRGSAPDIAHDTLSLEVKHRKALPDWITDAMQQAQASAREGQIPTVILHQKGEKYEKSLVVMELRDIIGLVAKSATKEE